MSNEIIRSETLAMESDALKRAMALVIASNEDYSRADAFSVGLQKLEKAIQADFKPAKDAAFAAHRAICAQESGHLDKVKEARSTIRPKLQAWEAIKRKESEEAARVAEEKARKEAEDAAIEAAAEAERNGDKATAQAIMDAPVEVAPVVLAPVIPQRKTRIPEAWGYKIVNESLVPREYMEPSDRKLGGLARSTKGSVKVPGVQFYDKNAMGV